MELLIIAFLSTYLAEKGFSAIQQLLTKSKNKLEIPPPGVIPHKKKTEKGDLRMMLLNTNRINIIY